MDSTSLKKPVDLQGLSLALAKTKADYEGKLSHIEDNIPQSDWHETDNTQKDYIWNKPAIVAGEGENSVMIGQIEQDEEARMYNISFDYPTEKTDTITFTTSDDLSDIANLSTTNKKYLVCNLEWDHTYNDITTHHNSWYCIIDIDVTNSTIVLDKTITFNSNYTYSSVYGTIFYKYKIAGDIYTVSEGKMTIAGGSCSHAEGFATKALSNNSHAEGYQTIVSEGYSHAEGYITTASGLYSHSEGSNTIASGNYSHSEGSRTTASGSHSHAEGGYTTVSGSYSHAEGYYTIASNKASHAEGTSTIASGDTSHAEGIGGIASGLSSHVEGGYNQTQALTLTGDANALTYTIASGTINAKHQDRLIGGYVNNSTSFSPTKPKVLSVTIKNDIVDSITLDKTLNATAAVSGTYYILLINKASGNSAHAEGKVAIASGNSSHAEGFFNLASGNSSHAEGYFTTASGVSSHAEGKYTEAIAEASHADGFGTIAQKQAQHVFGTYNIADIGTAYGIQGDYVEIVGNGDSDSTRSNARTLDWSGNEVLAGKLTVGVAPTNNMDVATKQYVDNATSGITTNLAGLTDTTITTPTDGQVLTYDSTTSKWVNSASAGGATYTLSIVNNVITLTGSDGSTSSVTLPVYNGTVTDVWEGGTY